MSEWDINQLFDQGTKENPRTGIYKYTKWNNPFGNGAEEVQTIACEGELLFDVKMLAPGIGSWFFSQFVPSPVELIRKTVVGGYRCGFYLRVKVKSPLDIIWRKGDASRFLARIARPFITPVFWLWGMQTIWEGLSMWQTMIFAAETCDESQDECITSGGQTTIRTPPNGAGNAQAGLDIWDPNGWHEGLEGSVFIPPEYYSQAHVYVTITGVGASVDYFRFELGLGNGGSANQAAVWEGSIANGGQESFALANDHHGAGPNDWTLPIEWSGLNLAVPLGSIQVAVQRLVVKSHESPLEPPCTEWHPGLNPAGT